jgi:hypothetical protein
VVPPLPGPAEPPFELPPFEPPTADVPALPLSPMGSDVAQASRANAARTDPKIENDLRERRGGVIAI